MRCWQQLPAAALVLATVSGCNLNPVRVQEPTTARPLPPAAQATQATGAIFNERVDYRPLFEDRRARYVGDTLVIQLNEKLQASRNNSTSASRKGEASVAIPIVRKLPIESLQGAALDAKSSNTFDGKGATAADNLFTGTITVTVIEVLPNGNLVVSGEKQIGITHNSETLRFSGVVDPRTIVFGNSVTSTQIADARIDYRGSGSIDEAQIMGWLARFFLAFIPF